MTRLTKQQSEELCRLAGIPNGHCDKFVRAVEGCVAVYCRLRERKTASAVGAELAIIENRILRALGLSERKTWRPGEFHTIIGDISARLRNLSPDAREYLQLRNLTIWHDLPSASADSIDHGVLIDPVCFRNRDDQVLALRDLFGAVAAPVAREKEHGRRRKDLERALYHFLAAAYSAYSGGTASDSSTKFMALCSEIKRIYQLDGWNPASLARLARR